MMVAVLKFKPMKQKSKRQKEGSKKPPRNYNEGSTAVHYCFELVAAALRRDNRDEVTEDILTWFIVNSDQETLTKFIKWMVEDNSKERK